MGDYQSVEEVFNANVEALLRKRQLTHQDLLARLEDAEYTPDTPATVLLNDALAIAAVLGVAPIKLLVPPEEEGVGITPALAVEARALSLWLRGMRPLVEDHTEEFFRGALPDDLDADLVAETWVWSERVRTTALVLLLEEAVEEQDMERVLMLSQLASRRLDQPALERADQRVGRFVPNGALQRALERATRYRRQTVNRRSATGDSGPAGS